MKKIFVKRIVTGVFVLWGALLLSGTVYAQNKTVSGQVTDEEEGGALPGVSVYVKGNTSLGSITDIEGRYSLTVPDDAVLVFSYIGYGKEERSVSGLSTINIALKTEGTTLTDVVVVGSRNASRSATDTPVPVDVVDMQELNVSAPQMNVNQILNYVAPSFTSTTQTVADGTDHIDPASLRGLGPDQVLVLVNGKRRHSSSLVNVNSSVGRGSVGTDLNAIPAYAIKRIEVLRDGAAAQYGSDAIAGVINIVLKDQNDGLDISATTGSYFSKNGDNFSGDPDGSDLQVNANYGAPIGDKGGFFNLTGSFYRRHPTSRARGFSGSIFHAYNAIEWQANRDGADIDALRTDVGAIQQYAQDVPYFSSELKSNIRNAPDLATLRDLLSDSDGTPTNVTEQELAVRGLTRDNFRMRVGQSELQSIRLFLNTAIPLKNGYEFYLFGGLGNRKGNAAGFYRRPDQSRANTAIYLNGFLPEISSSIEDHSVAAGVRTKKGQWNFDLSNTWGRNAFSFNIKNTLNASAGTATKRSYDAGGFAFMQNTVNLDASRFYPEVWEGLNVAAGAEYRFENYQLNAGEEGSYATYYEDGTVPTEAPDSARAARDFYGRLRPGGAQVFPGFRPNNARDESRHSGALYVDAEADITRKILASVAARYEYYSDFGGTFNFKIAGRWKATDDVSFRASGSSGFRAPSLHQLYFNAVSTNFINGEPFEIGTFSNVSQTASLLGIEQLDNETSYSGSFGVTVGIPDIDMKITLDGYYTRINDRVTLTGNFERPSGSQLTTGQAELQRLFDLAGANQARFFANSIDMNSYGAELVISQDFLFRNGFSLTNNLAASWFQTRQVGDIHASPQLAAAGLTGSYFGERDRVFLEEAMPRLKANLSHSLRLDKWSFFLRNSFFGQVTNANRDNGAEVTHGGRVITDLSVGYDFNKHINLTIGANNLLDVYPEEVPASLTSGSQFIYPRTTSQFAFNGRYLFARVNLSL